SGRPDPAGGRGQGRRRSREPPGSARAGPGTSVQALPAVPPGPCGFCGSGAASWVFLAGRDASRLRWPNLGSALSRDWARPSKGMASLAFPGGASPGFSGTRARSSLVVGPGTWKLALKRQRHGFPSGQPRPANARGSLHREAGGGRWRRGDFGPHREGPFGATGGARRTGTAGQGLSGEPRCAAGNREPPPPPTRSQALHPGELWREGRAAARAGAGKAGKKCEAAAGGEGEQRPRDGGQHGRLAAPGAGAATGVAVAWSREPCRARRLVRRLAQLCLAARRGPTTGRLCASGRRPAAERKTRWPPPPCTPRSPRRPRTLGLRRGRTFRSH
ncbi:hypothetical protein EI555_015323, partial [Monodon monoceros]